MTTDTTSKSKTVVHQGKLAIGDMGYAIQLWADYYKTASDAIKEFVINAVEAQASRICIYFYGVGTKPNFSIEDDGSGMVPERLGAIAVGICNSLKRGHEGLTGRHGIAMVSAARRLGAETLLVSSKPPGQAMAYTLAFPLTGKEINYQVYEDPRVSLAKGGTIVRLLGIPEKERKSLAMVTAAQENKGASRLALYLGAAYRGPILANRLSIIIERRGGRGQGDEYVQPVKFSGVPVNIGPLSTPFGQILLELFCRTSETKGHGVISIQHHAGPITTDLATELSTDFGREPWTRFDGQLTAPWLERSGGGVALRHKTYLAFRHALRKVEPQLREVYRHIADESISADDVGTLRKVFRQVLGGDSLLFPKRLQFPKTHLLTTAGEGRELQLVRSDLGNARGPTQQVGTGRQPYATPPPGRGPIMTGPVSKPPSRHLLSARSVSGLQWKLGPFTDAERAQCYKYEGGVIYVNTAFDQYVRFTDPSRYQGRRLTKTTLKLLWMAMVTCMVLVDINMPLDEYGTEERQLQLGILIGGISPQILG